MDNEPSLTQSSEKSPLPEKYVREVLLQKRQLDSTEYTIGNGRVVVDTARIDLHKPAEGLIRNVAIYMGGLPHRPEQSGAEDAQEAALIADLLTKKADTVIIMKPEGLNNEVYRDNGKALGQSRIAEASLIALRNLFALDTDFSTLEFTVYGFSEGASQGVSLAKRLIEDESTVCALYGFEPSGLVGYPSQDQAKVYPQFMQNLRKFLTAHQQNTKRPVTAKPYGHHVSKEMIQSYSDILGEIKPAFKDYAPDAVNLVARLIANLTPLRHGRAIVSERLKAVWSQNPDYMSLLQNKVPLRMFVGTKSDIVPVREAADQINQWRAEGYPAYLMTADISHMGPNSNSLALGYLSALTKE